MISEFEDFIPWLLKEPVINPAKAGRVTAMPNANDQVILNLSTS
jgi:hypothetical protein